MDINAVLKVAWFTPGLNGRWGLPLLFWGPPGVGKTRRIEEAARRCGLVCNTMLGSIRRPEDFGGFPIPVLKGKSTYMEFAPPAWAADVEVEGGGRGVVLTDELTTVEPQTQKALLRMVLDGFLGDHELSKMIRFTAAANSVMDAVGGYDLGGPLANRFGHLDFDKPDAREWCDWLIGVNGTSEHEDDDVLDPTVEEARVLNAWPAAFAKAKGIVGAFIKSFEQHLHDQPEAGSEARGRAWPSPRTWEMATRALAGCFVHRADEAVRDDLITAFVGAGACAQLVTFIVDVALPDPEMLLDGRIAWTHEPHRLDRTDAVMAACAALVRSDRCERREARVEALWGIIDRIVTDASVYDLVVTAARAAISTRLATGCSAKQHALVNLLPFLNAADIQPGETV
jgi:MoxR-like ATPase